MRPSGRKFDQLRNVKITPEFNPNAEGSCLIEMGNTKVICTASIETRVPGWMKAQGIEGGWVTAEYGMLPRSTNKRMDREASKGKQSSRTQEIQRLIGRSLRSVTNLKSLGQRTVWIDCDVIQADGGTRCASITGAYVAMHLAMQKLMQEHNLKYNPLEGFVAAISCGITTNGAVSDLDYAEDSSAIADGNFVMTEKQELIEVQTTAEKKPITEQELADMHKLAKQGIQELIKIQQKSIGM